MCICNTAVQMWKSGDNCSKSAILGRNFKMIALFKQTDCWPYYLY